MNEKCLINMSIRHRHERFAHQNVKHVRDILKSHDISYVDDWENNVCEGCVYGKQHRVSHPVNAKTASEPLDLIHVDLGEMDIRSLGGAKYFLLFKDDFTHYKTVYFLKSKDEAISKLRLYVKLVENQFGRTIKMLRSDHRD
uniref:Integrase catalytic domain-containing protein n=1 Tax=Trichogramma kaykai TaxID=54128 RepID=A0ABD2WB82_9HYME